MNNPNIANQYVISRMMEQHGRMTLYFDKYVERVAFRTDVKSKTEMTPCAIAIGSFPRNKISEEKNESQSVAISEASSNKCDCSGILAKQRVLKDESRF